jgi:hypothetical protein
MTDREPCPLCGEPTGQLTDHLEHDHDADDL